MGLNERRKIKELQETTQPGSVFGLIDTLLGLLFLVAFGRTPRLAPDRS